MAIKSFIVEEYFLKMLHFIITHPHYSCSLLGITFLYYLIILLAKKRLGCFLLDKTSGLVFFFIQFLNASFKIGCFGHTKWLFRKMSMVWCDVDAHQVHTISSNKVDTFLRLLFAVRSHLIFSPFSHCTALWLTLHAQTHINFLSKHLGLISILPYCFFSN